MSDKTIHDALSARGFRGAKGQLPAGKPIIALILSLLIAASAAVPSWADSHIASTFGILQDEKYDNLDEDPALSGGEVRFLYNEGGSGQQLSAVFRSSDGAVIVVDGGRDEDLEHLIRVIDEFGGKVDAWLITHPQADHAGALLEYLSDQRSDITIDAIYCHFLDGSWYDEADPAEAGIPKTLLALFSELHDTKVYGNVGRGFEETLSENMSFRVLNDPLQTTGDYAANAAGLMYDIDIDGKHFIILGDMPAEAGDTLLDMGVLDDIVCDYVQISHHGQRGVSEEFYRKLNPVDCIWPTNEYIYGAAGVTLSGLETTRTKLCISKLPVRHNYVTLGRDVVIR